MAPGACPSTTGEGARIATDLPTRTRRGASATLPIREESPWIRHFRPVPPGSSRSRARASSYEELPNRPRVRRATAEASVLRSAGTDLKNRAETTAPTIETPRVASGEGWRLRRDREAAPVPSPRERALPGHPVAHPGVAASQAGVPPRPLRSQPSGPGRVPRRHARISAKPLPGLENFRARGARLRRKAHHLRVGRRHSPCEPDQGDGG